uniref:Fibrinogen C-terminal domain-containing protein n=1 Tax=Amphimedon queenslandica TaxID=400682 RepID=A0A1X7SX10_AMPQE
AVTLDAASSTCTAAVSTCIESNATCTYCHSSNEGTPSSVAEELLRRNAKGIEATNQKMNGLIASVSEIKNTITSNTKSTLANARAIRELLELMEDLIALHNSSTSSSPLPTSCQEIKNKEPNSPSGVYALAVNDSDITYAYCHMGELCSSGGGWTRLAYLDMTDSKEICPSGFKLYQSGGVRACGRAYNADASCTSVQFPSNGISYSQVCGRVTGYQYATPDAVQHGLWQNPQHYVGGTDPKHNNINKAYVDGVSITRGSPRQHVWTLMGGVLGSRIAHDGRYNCPCSPGSTQSSFVQDFVKNNYFCESGAGTSTSRILYTADPLWDGQGCGTLETACCSAPGLPWFHRNYTTTTTDYIELRVCGDQETDDEDTPVSFYEIYVK